MASQYNKCMIAIINDYRAAGGVWPAKKTEVAEWALANGRWAPSRDDIRRMCSESLADAMRDETFTDESGRSVRAFLPAKTTRGGEHGTFWDHVPTAPIAHLRAGVATRRASIVAEVYHLYNVVRYSNEHRDASEQIELCLDFSEDVKELDQPLPQPGKAKRPPAVVDLAQPRIAARVKPPQPESRRRTRRPSVHS